MPQRYFLFHLSSFFVTQGEITLEKLTRLNFKIWKCNSNFLQVGLRFEFNEMKWGKLYEGGYMQYYWVQSINSQYSCRYFIDLSTAKLQSMISKTCSIYIQLAIVQLGQIERPYLYFNRILFLSHSWQKYMSFIHKKLQAVTQLASQLVSQCSTFVFGNSCL